MRAEMAMDPKQMKPVERDAASTAPGAKAEPWVEIVRRQVGSLEYGVVQIVVHGSRVVQIERTEKVRLTNLLQFEGQGRNLAVQTTGGPK